MAKNIIERIEEMDDLEDADLYEAGLNTVRQNKGVQALVDAIYDTFVGSTKDYIKEAEDAGAVVAEKASEAMANGIPPEYLDETHPPMELSEAQQQFADELDEAVYQARMTATKDPVTLIATGASAVAPWVFPVMTAPYVWNDIRKASEKGKGVEAATGMAAPALASMGASMFARSSPMLKYLPGIASKLGKPLVGSSVGAGVALMDDNTRQWAIDHPGRFMYNFFGNDIAYGAKSLHNGIVEAYNTPIPEFPREVKAKTTDTQTTPIGEVVFANKLNNEAPASKEKTSPTVKRDILSEEEGMSKPHKSTQKPETAAEHAFPENMEENVKRQQQRDAEFAKEYEEAQRLPETMQGAHGDRLVFGDKDLYPTPVSVDDIWLTAQKITPALPTRIQAEQNVGGFHYTIGEGIRVRGFTAWSVLAHEVGHDLSKKTGFGHDINVQAELKAGSESIWGNGHGGGAYGTTSTPEGHSVWVEEGRAAFMNEYFINPEMAEKHFPLAFKDFETRLARDPQLQALVKTLGMQMRKWGNSSVYQQVNSTISYANHNQPKLMDVIKKIDLDTQTAIFDKYTPIREIVDSFIETTPDTVLDEHNIVRLDADGNVMQTPKQISFEDHPANLAQRAEEGINAIVEDLIGDSGIDTPDIMQAVADKYGVALHNVTLKDSFDPLKQITPERRTEILHDFGLTEEQGLYEAYSAYKTSKHELEVIRVLNSRRIDNLVTEGNKQMHIIARVAREYDKQIVAKEREIGRAYKKLSNISMSDYLGVKEKMITQLEKAREKLLQRYASDDPDYSKQKHINDVFDKRIAKLEDMIDEATGKLVYSHGKSKRVEGLVNKIEGLEETINKAEAKRIEKIAKDTRDAAAEARHKNSDEAVAIDKVFEDMQTQLSKAVAALFQKGLGKHTKDIFDFIDSFEKDRQRLTNKKTTDPRVRRALAHIDDYNERILRIRTGLDDAATSAPRQKLIETVRLGDSIPEFVEASDLYNKWNENKLRIAVAGDVISKEDANYFLQAYPEYFPMKKSFAVEHTNRMGGDGGDKAYANIQKAYHALKIEGSERPIQDPLVQTVLDTQELISKIERNKVALAFVKLSEMHGGDKLLMDVNSVGNRPVNKEHIITVLENGKPKVYQCMTEGLYEAITVADKGLQTVSLNVAERLLQTAATGLRLGATSTYAFAATNMVKDLLNATMLNKDGRKTYLPIVDQVWLLWDGAMARADKQIMAEIKAEGMQYTSYIGSQKEINLKTRDYINGNQHYMKDVFKKIFLDPIEIGEQLPRLGLYKRARARGCSPAEAAYIASDGTVNFMRSGTQVKKVNRYIPFFNAIIQGDNKIFRAIKEDPVGVGMCAFTYLTVPSLISWYKNHDKDWYRDMPLDKKNKYWYWDMSLAQDGSAVLALPKNEFLGYFFGSVPERILDFIVDNDRDDGVATTTIRQSLEQLIPSGFPTAFLPLIEWWSNYSFFRDRPIVDARTLKLKPEDQYDVYTSSVAVGLGKATGLSPKKIDNTIYDLTGTLGYTMNNLIDMAVKDNTRSSRKWTEYTRFTYTPDTSHSRSMDVFYRGLDRLEAEDGSERKHRGDKPTKKGKSRKKTSVSEDLKKMRRADAKAKEISTQLAALEADTTIKDGDVKRAKRDILIKKRNDTYRQANKDILKYKYIQAPK